MFSRLCFNAVTLAALAAAAPGLRGLTNTSNTTMMQRSANGCDCSWIANDDCINQDPCAVSCRQSHGSPCSVGAAGGAACHATCDSSFGSCNRWCHIPPGGGPYYTAEEEEALKGQIMQCEGKCTVTRGNCYQSCGATKSTKTQRSANGCDCSWIANDDCINQDPCAVSCRQSHGSPCSVGAAGGAACHATCDSTFGSCNRWCHIPPGGGPYYTAEEEEALKGQIMQCEGKCTVTRGNCYQGCR